MKELIERLEAIEEAMTPKSIAMLEKVFEDWFDKVSKLMKGIGKLKKEKMVTELVGEDLEEMYNAVDDALLLVERMLKKVEKASEAA